MKLKWIFSAGIIGLLFVAGCEQTGTGLDEYTDNVTMAEEEVADLKSAEATSSDVCSARFAGHLFKGGMMMGGSHLLFGNGFPSCATITVDSEEFPKTVTIDYGDGCSGRMGLEKRGVITIYMSDTIINEGAFY